MVFFSRVLMFFTVLTLLTLVSSQNCDSDIILMDNNSIPKVFRNASGWYAGIASKLLYTYHNSVDGFSALLTPTELESIKNSEGFISSFKDHPVKLYTTRTAHFLGLNYDYGVWPASNLGEGIIIGMVDTGIWPESPSFSDHGMPPVPSRWKGECHFFNSSMCNKKLIGARFFSKGTGLSDAADPKSMINSPRDTHGHGTHTSSIAAGNYVDGASWFGYASGMARGMAPRAALAMYKLSLECLSDVLAAIDQAIVDGVDILSMSFGLTGVPLNENPLAAATFAAMEKGIFVSMAAGNDGHHDAQPVSNDFPWSTTVGSGTIDRTFHGTIILGNGVSIQGYALYRGKSITQKLPIVFVKTCDTFTVLQQNQSNKIIVCQKSSQLTNRSNNSNVDAAGVAIAGLVYIMNDPAGELLENGKVLYSDESALLVTPENGKVLVEYINKTANPTGSMYFQETYVGIKPAPMVWSGSSRGPSASFPSVLKPDVIAPGVMVLGSWIPYIKGQTTRNNTGFTIETGTSMACPHVAGVAALLKKAHPEWTPAAIRSAILTTSDILDNTHNSIRDDGNNGLAATPLAMGAGHLNPNRALDPGLIYDIGREDYVNLLCGMNWTTKQIQAVVRSATFNCSHPTLDLNYPSFVAYFNNTRNTSASTSTSTSTATKKVFHRTVTNVGEKGSRYVAELTAMKGFNLSVQPQFLEFKDRFQILSYKFIIEAPTVMENPVVTGYLSWVNLLGTQVVRSPIVVTMSV